MNEYEMAKLIAECLARYLPMELLMKLNNDSVVYNRRYIGIEDNEGNEYLVTIEVDKA